MIGAVDEDCRAIFGSLEHIVRPQKGHALDEKLQPVPSRYAYRAELDGLASVLGEYGRMLQVVPEYSRIFVRDRFDQVITALVGGPGRWVFDAWAWFERSVIRGAVNGIGTGSPPPGGVPRPPLQAYARTSPPGPDASVARRNPAFGRRRGQASRCLSPRRG